MAIDFDPTLPQEEREGLLKPLQEGNLGGFARGLGQLLLPTTGFEGQQSLGDIFRGFVEFTKIGDIGDFLAGVNPDVDLDPLERALAIAGIGSVAGVGAIGVRNQYRRLTQPPQITHAPSMRNPDGSFYQPGDIFDLQSVPQVGSDPETVRQHQAHMERLAVESKSPFVRSALRAQAWHELAVAHQVRGWQVTELQAVGKAVVALSRNPELYYGADPEAQHFTAAKIATAKWRRAEDLGLLDLSQVRKFPYSRDQELSLVVQLHLATESVVGPDLLLDSPARIGLVRLTGDTETHAAEARVMVGVIDELLPSERLFDHDRLMPLDEPGIQKRLLATDWEALEGIKASNVLRALVEQSYFPDGTWNQDSVGWYYKFNQSAKVLAEATGFSVTQTAGVLATLSANAPWHHNLASSIHTILQIGRPDLQVGSPEYNQIFRDATIGSGWAQDLYNYSGREVQLLAAEGGLDAVAMHYADPENLRGEQGNLAATDGEKLARVDLILKANLPPWMVMRMMKTNTFGRIGAEPGLAELADLVTIDRHNYNIANGSVWVGDVISHDGRTDGVIDPDQTYTNPVTGEQILGRDVEAALESMRDHGWTDQDIAKWRKTLAAFPSTVNMERYLSDSRAHLLARDEAGLEFGHEAQAGSWPFGQNMDRRGVEQAYVRLGESASLEEIREITRQATFDSTILNHAEGNPLFGMTSAGFLANVAEGLTGRSPTLEQLERARQGVKRPTSSQVHAGIVLDFGADGKASVWVDTRRTEAPGLFEAVRHLAPSGVRVGQWERWVPRADKTVTSASDHLKTVSQYTNEDGSPVAVEGLLLYGPELQHPATTPGTKIMVQVPAGQKTSLELALSETLHGNVAYHRGQRSRTGAARTSLTIHDLEGLNAEQLTEVLRNTDWYGIASKNMDLLERDVKRMGGSIIQSHGYWTEDGAVFDEPSVLVTGISPEQAFELGRKHDQISVASRWGLLYTTGDKAGTYNPATGEYFWDDNALPEAWTEILGLQRKFTAGYDFERTLTFDPANPESVRTVLDHGLEDSDVLSVAIIDMGGTEGSPLSTWNNVERTVRALERVPGAKVRLYSNALNHVPPGYTKAYEAVFRDDAGVVGSVLMGAGDSYARHQGEVWVSSREAKTLTQEPIGPEGFTRSPLDARQILRIDEELGEIWFDSDVVIAYPPDADIKIGAKGPIFKSMRMNGRKVTSLVVDTRGPIPTIRPNETTAPEPGLVTVDLADGQATTLSHYLDSDWLPARDALARAGLVIDGESIDVRTPQRGSLDNATPIVSLYVENFQPSESKRILNDLRRSRSDTDTDFQNALIDRGASPAVINLGRIATPEVKNRIQETVLNMLDGTGKFTESARIVGRVPPHIWDNQVLTSARLRFIRGGALAAHIGPQATFRTDLLGIFIEEDSISQFFNPGHMVERSDAVRVSGTNELEVTITHEIGHLIASYVRPTEYRALIDTARDSLGGRLGSWMALSRYSAWNDNEFFAEAFAKVLLDPRGAPEPLIDMVKEALAIARTTNVQYHHP